MKLRKDLRKVRKDAADERTEYWTKLSPQQQLEALDMRLGKDTGAAKQRARLMKRIEKQSKETR